MCAKPELNTYFKVTDNDLCGSVANNLNYLYTRVQVRAIDHVNEKLSQLSYLTAKLNDLL